MTKDKLISIIIPVYNEEKNLLPLYDGVIKALEKTDCDHEIIFIDDGSRDSSLEKLKSIAESDENIKILEFSRNFGKEIAVTAGINHCLGDACIMIDADLQHPPNLITEFIKKWEDGAEVVVGVRKENNEKNLAKKLGSLLFYKIMGKISETDITPNATDFRLLDRTVVDAFNRFSERNRMTRALIDWLGFDREYVYFKAEKRMSGKAGYSFFKLLKLALSGFISHSLFPLKFAGYLGIVITFFSGTLGLFIFIEKYILNDPWGLSFSGPAILAVIILFLVGIVLVCLGLIALYIANIHGEVIGRPLYVIKNTIKDKDDNRKSNNYFKAGPSKTNHFS